MRGEMLGRERGFAGGIDLHRQSRVSCARLQARWEVSNLTNAVNLGGFLSTSIRSSWFGKIGSTPDVDRGNPVLGTGGPRAMQWALKVLF